MHCCIVLARGLRRVSPTIGRDWMNALAGHIHGIFVFSCISNVALLAYGFHFTGID